MDSLIKFLISKFLSGRRKQSVLAAYLLIDEVMQSSSDEEISDAEKERLNKKFWEFVDAVLK